MAVKTKSQLRAFADANLKTNGVNSNTGANHNTMLNNLIDSFVNSASDPLSIVTNVYRKGTKILVKDTPVQITFSSALPSAAYGEPIIFDPNGIGWGSITDKLATGFKITGFSPGPITYFVILNN